MSLEAYPIVDILDKPIRENSRRHTMPRDYTPLCRHYVDATKLSRAIYAQCRGVWLIIVRDNNGSFVPTEHRR